MHIPKHSQKAGIACEKNINSRHLLGLTLRSSETVTYSHCTCTSRNHHQAWLSDFPQVYAITQFATSISNIPRHWHPSVTKLLLQKRTPNSSSQVLAVSCSIPPTFSQSPLLAFLRAVNKRHLLLFFSLRVSQGSCKMAVLIWPLPVSTNGKSIPLWIPKNVCRSLITFLRGLYYFLP